MDIELFIHDFNNTNGCHIEELFINKNIFTMFNNTHLEIILSVV